MNIIKSKKNLGYIILFSIIVLACSWAFISAGIITKSFKNKIEDQTYKNKEANIENLLVTETKDGEKSWELYSDIGTYSDIDSVVFLQGIIGNFYDKKEVKASFKADKGSYDSEKKEIILNENVIIVYKDGTNIKADRIVYPGKGQDITATGNIRIEKPNEAITMGTKAILKGDFTDFNITGRTRTQFYLD